MNNFDKPVEKAKTDAEILDALQGVKMTQDELRRSKCGSVGLAFFRAYYEKLPDEVARRLTEIDTDAVERITPEQVGVLKALKIAIELDKFLRRLEAEGRKQYTIGEIADEVFLPVWKL